MSNPPRTEWDEVWRPQVEEQKAFLAGQHEAWIKELKDDVREIKTCLHEMKNHYEKRFQTLERWRNVLTGAWAAIVGLWAVVFGGKS